MHPFKMSPGMMAHFLIYMDMHTNLNLSFFNHFFNVEFISTLHLNEVGANDLSLMFMLTKHVFVLRSALIGLACRSP